MKVRENYMPFVRDEDCKDVGGISGGFYTRIDGFTLIIRSSAANQEELLQQIALIPNFNSEFNHAVIE